MQTDRLRVAMWCDTGFRSFSDTDSDDEGEGRMLGEMEASETCYFEV